jgi:hypothetical protein
MISSNKAIGHFDLSCVGTEPNSGIVRLNIRLAKTFGSLLRIWNNCISLIYVWGCYNDGCFVVVAAVVVVGVAAKTNEKIKDHRRNHVIVVDV